MFLKLLKKHLLVGEGVITSRQISPFHVTTEERTIIIDTLLWTEANQILLFRSFCWGLSRPFKDTIITKLRSHESAKLF